MNSNAIKEYVSNNKKIIINYSIGVILFLMLTLFIVKNGKNTVSSLIDYSRDHIIIVTSILFFLFALKSVSFGLPYALLFATVGAIYPLFMAFIVNLIGIYINIQIPYFIGRRKGEAFVIYTQEKFPFIKKLYAVSAKSQFFFTFIIKIIGKIPHEITNLFLGALKIPYHSYVVASLLALSPTMVSITLLAKNYDDPSSPIFIISLSIFLLMPIISFILYFRNRDSNKN